MGLRARLRLTAIGAAQPRVYTVTRREISIGSAPGNDLAIAGHGVSRQHATLARRSGGWRVADHGSTNGTFVNGVKIGGSTEVKPGDELAFGAARYAVTTAPDPRRGWFTPARAAATAAILFALGFAGAEFKLRAAREAAGRPAPSVVPKPTLTAGRSATRPSYTIAASPGPSPAPVAVARASSVPTALASSPAAPTPAAAGSGGPWLDALNHYRALAKLAPVVADDASSRADRAHARYLVKTFAAEIRAGRNPGVEIHEENSSSPWYSAAGARAGGHSDIAEWPGPIEPPSPAWAINLWIEGPFHRLPMLNPRMRTVSYGDYCENGVCVVLLDVLDGVSTAPIGLKMAYPVEFPPDGATTTLEGESGEWPDPLSACPGYAEPTGLPITLQTAYFHPVKLESFSITQSDGAAIAACGIDAATYVNPDPETQKRGREILAAFGAIILIPREPLRPDQYKVAIATDERDYSWSFRSAR